MENWLFNILKDNTLKDNQTYIVQDGVFSNNRLKHNMFLKSRVGSEWERPYNNEKELWLFLNQTSQTVNSYMSNNKNEVLKLFNNKEYEHNTDDDFINISGSDCKNFKLQTGNVIGYIKDREYSIKISSRFGDEFLKYIISDADGFLELENYGGSNNDEGYRWLLIYLWKIKLKKAFRLGLPKIYKTHTDKLNKVKGRIDLPSYFISEKNGTYLCHFREHSYNNPAVNLIAKTFNKIKGDAFVLDLHHIRNTFVTATNGHSLSIQELLNTPHFSNPFYRDYNDVIDLSKLLLRDEKSDFGNNSENSAFLFDISMLFEYFIRKLLIKEGVFVKSKFEKRLDIPTGNFTGFRRKLEPDLVIETKKGVFVFDVKYKTYDFTFGVKREDVFQMHTYVGQYGNSSKLSGCGFIYPIEEEKWYSKSNHQSQLIIVEELQIMGKIIPFYIFYLPVPSTKSVQDFNQIFQKNCKKFTELFKLKLF